MKPKLLKESILMMVMTLAPVAGNAATKFVADNLQYTVLSSDEATVSVTSTNNTPNDVVIPSKITYNDVEYTVTTVERFTNSGLTSISIPSSVIKLNDNTFYGKINLKTVVFEDGSTLHQIPQNAFYQCKKLEDITIPDSVETIGNSAFNECTSLSGFSFPENLTSIGNSAFSRCSGLTSIVLPAKLSSIGDEAFFNCSALADIEFPNSLRSIGTRAFSSYSSKAPAVTSIVFPEGLESIGDNAFNSCRSLTYVKFPSTITRIGNDAFAGGNSKLETIEFAEGIQNLAIGNNAFKQTIVKDIVIPEGTVSLGNSVFSQCTMMESITIPNSLESIGSGCFSGCSNLKNVDLKDKGFIIETSNTFEYCTSLTTITIPESTTAIGASTFTGSGIETIDIPAGVTKIGNNAFSKTKFTSFNVPSSVTVIGNDAFKNCKELTNFDMGENVEQIYTEKNGVISGGILTGCDKLKTVRLSDKIKLIPTQTFENCTALESIAVPASVDTIDITAFNGCTALKEILVDDNNKDYSSASGCLYDKSATELIYCPLGITDFEPASTLTKIRKEAFMGNTSIVDFIVPENVVEIGDRAFAKCPNLVSVDIPASTSVLGTGVFMGNNELKKVNIASGNVTFKSLDGMVTSADGTGIEWCAPKNVEAVIQEGVERIAPYAFYEWEGTVMDFPASLKELGEYCFYKAGIEVLHVPGTVAELPDYAFASCPNLEQIFIPEGVRKIGGYVFAASYKSGKFGPEYSLKEVHSESSVPPATVEKSFGNYWLFPTDCKLYIPFGSKEAYLNPVADNAFYSIWGRNPDNGNVIEKDFTVGVEEITDGFESVEVSRHDLNGIAVGPDHKGLVIIRYSDGTAKKAIVK